MSLIGSLTLKLGIMSDTVAKRVAKFWELRAKILILLVNKSFFLLSSVSKQLNSMWNKILQRNKQNVVKIAKHLNMSLKIVYEKPSKLSKSVKTPSKFQLKLSKIDDYWE